MTSVPDYRLVPVEAGPNGSGRRSKSDDRTLVPSADPFFVFRKEKKFTVKQGKVWVK